MVEGHQRLQQLRTDRARRAATPDVAAPLTRAATLLCALLVAVVAAVPSAWAAPAGPQPIEGGRASATAPTLSTGVFSDQILATDALWYGFDLQPGQILRATLTVRGGVAGSLTPFSQLQFELRAADVLGGLRCDVDAVRGVADPGGTIMVREAAAEVSGQEIVPGAGLCRDPGRYYLRLELADAVRRSRVADQAQRVGQDPEVNIELAVEITPAAEAPAAAGSEAPPRGGGISRVSAGGVTPPNMAIALLLVAVLGCAVAGLATGTAVAKRVAKRS